MRLWSLHPKYLDAKGLVALWREALLAKNVLEGRTKGYKNHPQLNRFKESPSPIAAINHYLSVVHHEALARHYKFDKQKFSVPVDGVIIPVTKGQLEFEVAHLLNKLKSRDTIKHDGLLIIESFEPHPLFTIVEGGIEKWEII